MCGDHSSDMGKLRLSMFKSTKVLERLGRWSHFEDGRHYTFVYEDEDLVYEEEVL